MEIFSALLALCEGNPLVIDGFPSQRPVTRSFDVFFDLHLNIRLSKQSKCRWFETPLCSLWRHCNGHRNGNVISNDEISVTDCARVGQNDNFQGAALEVVVLTNSAASFMKNSSRWEHLSFRDDDTIFGLTLRGLNDACRHFQIYFLQTKIKKKKKITFSFKFHWSLFPRVPLTINQH